MRYEDGPTVEVEVLIDAPIERVWALVTDIDLPARFSTEFLGATWLDDGPARRRPVRRAAITTPRSGSGRRRRSSTGTSRCARSVGGHRRRQPVVELVVRARAAGRRRAAPPRHAGWARRRRGSRIAITAMPDKEERIIARRLEEFEANMRATLEGIKQLAEDRARDAARRRRAAMPFSPHGVEFVRQAEQLGVDSVWVPEFWAGDALTPLAYLAAARRRRSGSRTGIVQLGARTPAMLAMSALSLQALSGGRFVLGVGTSGPQVMEGWHGVRFDRPVRRTRETIEIIRAITRRRAPRVPRRDLRAAAARRRGPHASARSCRRRTSRSTSPRSGRRTCASPASSPTGGSATRSSPRPPTCSSIRSATAPQRPAATLADLDLTVSVGVEFTDDVEAAGRRHAEGYAFTFGAMGSATTNFYNDAFDRQGYGDDVREVQRLWLAGDKDAARKRVPIAIGLGTNLIGTDDLVRERLRLYRDAGVDDAARRPARRPTTDDAPARRPRPPARPRRATSTPRRREGRRGAADRASRPCRSRGATRLRTARAPGRSTRWRPGLLVRRPCRAAGTARSRERCTPPGRAASNRAWPGWYDSAGSDGSPRPVVGAVVDEHDAVVGAGPRADRARRATSRSDAAREQQRSQRLVPGDAVDLPARRRR